MKKLSNAAWTPFRPGVLSHDPAEHRHLLQLTETDEVWVNNRYQVNLRRRPHPDFGELVHLSIKRRDKQPIRDWRDLQRIKNELVGPEIEAVELFPAESRLVDTTNQFHLWCLPSGYRFSFGYRERLVMEGDEAYTRQRPFRDPVVRQEAQVSTAKILGR